MFENAPSANRANGARTVLITELPTAIFAFASEWWARHQGVNALNNRSFEKARRTFQKKRWSFSKKRWRFFQKRWSFFSKRRRFFQKRWSFFSKRRSFSAAPRGEEFRCSFVAHSMLRKWCLETEEKATSTALVRCSFLAQSNSAFRHSSIHFHSKNTIFWRSRQISPIISRFGGEKRIEIEAKSFPIGHQTVNDRLGGNNSRRYTCTI